MTPALSDKTPEEIRLYNAMVRKLFPELEGEMGKAKEEAWRGSGADTAERPQVRTRD